MKVLFALLTTLSLVAACTDEDDKVFKKSGNAETKPVATLAVGAGVQALDAASAPPTEAASVTYAMTIKGNSGAKLCEGEATLSIMSDFGLKFPAAQIRCVSLTVDLAGILGASGGLTAPGDNKDPNLTHDGKVLSVKTIAGATFSPPRPFLVGPIIQNPADYRGFTRVSQHSMQAQDTTTGQVVGGQGSFSIQVLDVDTTYENKYVGKAFDKILHWQISASGFTGVPARYGLIFEKMEWLWNTRPIMIPKVTIVGKLSDFITADGNSGMANDIVGTVTVELVVKSYDFTK